MLRDRPVVGIRDAGISEKLQTDLDAGARKENEAFLGMMTAGTTQNSWVVTLEVRGHVIPFKQDTGAEVTPFTEQCYESMGRTKLSNPFRVLCGPARQRLDVVGQSEAKLTKGECSINGPIYMVKGLRSNLLSFQTIARSTNQHDGNRTTRCQKAVS